MPQVAFKGYAEVIDEDYYEYEIPPNLTIQIEIDSHVYHLKLSNDPKKRRTNGIWYNKTSLCEIL